MERRQSRYNSLSITDAIARVRDVTRTIKRREGVKPHERKRIQEALTLLRESAQSVDSTSEKGSAYRAFLHKVRKVAGLQMVILCAVGIGRSAVSTMRDKVRVDLPFELKDQCSNLEFGIIQRIAEDSTAKCQTTVPAHFLTIS